jgi:hypothetical protein
MLSSLKLPPAIGRLFVMMSVLISLLQTLRGFVQSRAALHLGVLALRHQLQVLERSRPKRLRIVKADRLSSANIFDDAVQACLPQN